MGGTAGTGAGGDAGTGAAGTGNAGSGGTLTCEDVRTATNEELTAIRTCTTDTECGQVLTGTSCGCTRELVARLDADLTRFDELRTTRVDGQTCSTFGGSCDCPAADGFECANNQCTWRYVDTSCQNLTIGMLCVVGPEDGMLDVGDPLTIMVGANGCYSSSCTETVIGECSVEDTGNGDYVGDAQICVRADSSGPCTDDCGGAPSPRCESETPLSAGRHRVSVGGFSLEFEVPMALSGARCSGFL